MALTSVGLNDVGFGPGLTTNFQVQYEDTLPNQANVKRNADALLAVVENEFTVTTGWFNTPAGKFGTGHRQVVNLNRADGTGANNSGYGSSINMDAQGGNANASDAAARLGMIFINEWVEVLMDLTGGKWNRVDSSGEGLSQFLGILRFQAGHYSYYSSWVDTWLNKHPREDWVNKTESTDTNTVSFGCALAFLYYLNQQLNFSVNQIIAAGAANLASVYTKLTGDPGDPFALFAGLIENVYPSSGTVNLPGPVSDNPFPLARLAFWVDKNTFGKDEVSDVIKSSAGQWPKAFWLVAEGFSKDSFGALGVTVPAPTGAFASLAGVSLTQDPNVDFENAAESAAPQRIRVPYTIAVSNAALADFPSTGTLNEDLNASLAIGGTKVKGSDASTQFELVAGADPYFTNIDPSRDNVFYLSQDLRVFTGTPAENNLPVPGGPSFSSDSVAGAFDYIQQLLTFLNANFFDPNGADPFNTILPSQVDALTGDSSVTPFNNVEDVLSNNYNFAVARVRLRGSAGPVGQAKNVRVFFRLWTTQTADTDYQTGSTYPSTTSATGLPTSPLVGTDHHTIPFFATGNLSGNTDYAPAGANIRDITIPAGADSVWAYFGCFLNLYDTTNEIDGKPVQAWLTGTHHCIVAQIAFDGTPLGAGDSPERSDKLAQRNLQITFSDNPGPPATHRIPQTFDIRPSPAGSIPGSPTSGLDELMIDWGGIPPGSVAFIHWPQVLASDVLDLAAKTSAHGLSAADAHTIRCDVLKGVTYVPIPAGTGDNLAGLFTVQLPPSVVAGQEFRVVVRRIGTQQFTPVIVHTPPSTVGPGPAPGAVVPAASTTITWRYVVGTFQVTIPVTTPDKMLPVEQNTLAVMKWRLGQMTPGSRWFPVLQRYVVQSAARVDGLGGNSSVIPPSPGGFPPTAVKSAKVEITFPPNFSTFLAGKPIEVRGNATWLTPGPSPVVSMQLSAFESRFNGISFGPWIHVNDFPLTLVPQGTNALTWSCVVVPFDGMARYMLTAFAFDDTNTLIGTSDPLFLKSV